METGFYALKTLEERRAWLTEQNRRRCIEAQARKAAEPKADAEDFEFNPPSR